MKLILSLIVGFAVLIFCGLLYDAGQKIDDLQNQIHDINQQIEKQEDRFLNNIPADVASSSALEPLIKQYREAKVRSEKEPLFTQISALVSTASAGNDSPIARRAQDEMAGALNRRKILSETIDEPKVKLQKHRQTFFGSFFSVDD